MTSKHRAALKRAINQLVRAAIADSWKGGGDPADIPAIERELELAKRRVNDAIARISVASETQS